MSCRQRTSTTEPRCRCGRREADDEVATPERRTLRWRLAAKGDLRSGQANPRALPANAQVHPGAGRPEKSGLFAFRLAPSVWYTLNAHERALCVVVSESWLRASSAKR
jgi:hypothetical protein